MKPRGHENVCGKCGGAMHTVPCPDDDDGCMVLHQACPKCSKPKVSFGDVVEDYQKALGGSLSDEDVREGVQGGSIGPKTGAAILRHRKGKR